MTTRLHRALQSKTVKARVSTCEGLCAHPTIRVASVHLRGNETQCWGLCARLWRETVFQKIRMKKQGAGTGRLGRSPNLSAALLTASQRIFQRICVRQNAPGKGRAEGSKKEQDKGRGSRAPTARPTSPRNAGHFKGFDVLKRGDQRWSVGITSDVIGGLAPPQTRMAQRV